MPPEVAIGAIGRLQVGTQCNVGSIKTFVFIYETLLLMSLSIVHYLQAG